MKNLKLIAVALMLLFAPLSAFGMSKCVNAKGKTTFTNGVCPQGYESFVKKGFKAEGPPTPPPPFVYGQYKFEELLRMEDTKVFKMYGQMSIKDPDFDGRYACTVEKAYDYHKERMAINSLERATSLSGMMVYTDDVVDARMGTKIYCD